jgi:hypothetical protein
MPDAGPDHAAGGFTQIDCVYKNQITAVMVAVNER